MITKSNSSTGEQETGERSTPRPWKLGAQVLHQGVLSRNVFSEVAGGTWGGGYIGIFTEANAELIVTAVNAFAELERERDALREALREVRKRLGPKDEEAHAPVCQCLLCVIDKALGETK